MTACEGALWAKGTFIAAYTGNIEEAVETVLENDQVAAVLRTYMDMTPDGFTGTAANLLKALNDVASETQQKAKGWPKRPAGLGSLLRRIAPPLRKVGIEITFDRTPGGKRTRTITIARKEGAPDRPDRPDRPTAQDIINTLKNKVWDGADGRDANFHTQTSKGTEVICAHCGRPGGNEVAFGDEIGPVWLHRECEVPWIERRMGEEGILRA